MIAEFLRWLAGILDPSSPEKSKQAEACQSEDLQAFVAAVKKRVPGATGNLGVFADEVYLEIGAPIPNYNPSWAAVRFASHGNQRVRCKKERDIAEACLAACQYDDLAVCTPGDLKIFYENDTATLLKKGETIESLKILKDLEG